MKISEREREKFQEYLKQLASIKRKLQTLYLMSADINGLELMGDEQVTLQLCDRAVDDLLDTIYDYCE